MLSSPAPQQNMQCNIYITNEAQEQRMIFLGWWERRQREKRDALIGYDENT